MEQMSSRLRIMLLSAIMFAMLAFMGWLIWSSSVDRIPSDAILVMHERKESPLEEAVFPYYTISTGRVMV